MSEDEVQIKTCRDCEVELPKRNRTGLCEKCHKIDYYKKNKNKILKYSKEYYQDNKEEKLKYRKEYCLKNKEKRAKQCADYNRKNKERISKYQKEKYKKNKNKILKRSKEYYQKNKNNISNRKRKYYQKNKVKINKQRAGYQRKYTKNKYNTDLNFKITCCLRSRLIHALRGKTKSAKTLELLGCSVEYLKQHLESQFTEGMTWDNHGEWHIDHIKPCKAFDLTNPEEQKKCFHYTNLQPLWGPDNIAKSDKWDGTDENELNQPVSA